MGFPVILTEKAIEDLATIVAFIAADNSERARSFGNLLIDRALAIRPFPEIGRVVPEIGDSEVREILQGSYRIIYRVIHDPDAIYILRFWHGARGEPEIPIP